MRKHPVLTYNHKFYIANLLVLLFFLGGSMKAQQLHEIQLYSSKDSILIYTKVELINLSDSSTTSSVISTPTVLQKGINTFKNDSLINLIISKQELEASNSYFLCFKIIDAMNDSIIKYQEQLQCKNLFYKLKDSILLEIKTPYLDSIGYFVITYKDSTIRANSSYFAKPLDVKSIYSITYLSQKTNKIIYTKRFRKKTKLSVFIDNVTPKHQGSYISLETHYSENQNLPQIDSSQNILANFTQLQGQSNIQLLNIPFNASFSYLIQNGESVQQAWAKPYNYFKLSLNTQQLISNVSQKANKEYEIKIPHLPSLDNKTITTPDIPSLDSSRLDTSKINLNSKYQIPDTSGFYNQDFNVPNTLDTANLKQFNKMPIDSSKIQQPVNLSRLPSQSSLDPNVLTLNPSKLLTSINALEIGLVTPKRLDDRSVFLLYKNVNGFKIDLKIKNSLSIYALKGKSIYNYYYEQNNENYNVNELGIEIKTKKNSSYFLFIYSITPENIVATFSKIQTKQQISKSFSLGCSIDVNNAEIKESFNYKLDITYKIKQVSVTAYHINIPISTNDILVVNPIQFSKLYGVNTDFFLFKNRMNVNLGINNQIQNPANEESSVQSSVNYSFSINTLFSKLPNISVSYLPFRSTEVYDNGAPNGTSKIFSDVNSLLLSINYGFRIVRSKATFTYSFLDATNAYTLEIPTNTVVYNSNLQSHTLLVTIKNKKYKVQGIATAVLTSTRYNNYSLSYDYAIKKSLTIGLSSIYMLTNSIFLRHNVLLNTKYQFSKGFFWASCGIGKYSTFNYAPLVNIGVSLII